MGADDTTSGNKQRRRRKNAPPVAASRCVLSDLLPGEIVCTTYDLKRKNTTELGLLLVLAVLGLYLYAWIESIQSLPDISTGRHIGVNMNLALMERDIVPLGSLKDNSESGLDISAVHKDTSSDNTQTSGEKEQNGKKEKKKQHHKKKILVVDSHAGGGEHEQDNIPIPVGIAADPLLHITDYGKRTPFPGSIDPNSYVSIPHPATELSPTLSSQISALSVPPLWDPPAFIPYGGVRHYLGDYGSTLMTPGQAHTIGSYVTIRSEETMEYIELETIFIAIASYRDFQCRQTIESAFGAATYPQRLRIGVVDQYDSTYVDTEAYQEPICSRTEHPCETHPEQILCKYKAQIDFYPMEAKYAVGPVFARHLGQRMYRGEYFAVQSDAHVDFIKDWDVSIIEQWHSAQNEMAVLTAYLSDIHGNIDPTTGKSLSHTRPIMCQSDYEGSGKKAHLRHGQQPEGPAGIKGEPTLEPYWAAGFSFARGHFVVNVPYDQHLPMIFMGEEISMGLRGFTYGYDYYTAERSICFHYYASQDKTGKRHHIKMYWENSGLYSGVEGKAMMRLNGIIDMNPEIDPSEWLHEDEKMYGLGKVRATHKFFETFGIDTMKKKIQKHLCQFVGKNMHHIWKQHLRTDRMGINYDEIDFKFQDPVQFGRTWEKYLK